jgi:hypothetical protein
VARHLDGVDAVGAAGSFHLDFRTAPNAKSSPTASCTDSLTRMSPRAASAGTRAAIAMLRPNRCPARHVLEPTLPFGIDGSSGIVAALFFNPHAESVFFGHVGDRDSGVTVAFDVVQKSAETVLPPVDMRAPCPARQLLESALTLGLKGALRVVVALRVDHAPSL